MRDAKPAAIVTGSNAVAAVPLAPRWLSKSAQAEWRRVAPVLISERKTLTVADLAVFAHYCAAVGQVADAARIIAEEGLTFSGASGPKKHPAVAIQNDAMTQARLLAAELGLTPVSRSRPSMRDSDDDADISGMAI